MGFVVVVVVLTDVRDGEVEVAHDEVGVVFVVVLVNVEELLDLVVVVVSRVDVNIEDANAVVVVVQVDVVNAAFDKLLVVLVGVVFEVVFLHKALLNKDDIAANVGNVMRRREYVVARRLKHHVEFTPIIM